MLGEQLQVYIVYFFNAFYSYDFLLSYIYMFVFCPVSGFKAGGLLHTFENWKFMWQHFIKIFSCAPYVNCGFWSIYVWLCQSEFLLFNFYLLYLVSVLVNCFAFWIYENNLLQELEPFPVFQIFDEIRNFHEELCHTYSIRDHILKVNNNYFAFLIYGCKLFSFKLIIFSLVIWHIVYFQFVKKSCYLPPRLLLSRWYSHIASSYLNMTKFKVPILLKY